VQQAGCRIGEPNVADLLPQLRDRLQTNATTIEGTQHPDRKAHFTYTNRQTTAFHRRDRPAIPVDAKKEALVGSCMNAAREWERRHGPVSMSPRDFTTPARGEVVPFGGADPMANHGYVNVSINQDTADCPINTLSIRRRQMDRRTCPQAGGTVEPGGFGCAQREPASPLERRGATPGERALPAKHRVSRFARYEQAEQNRAPRVLRDHADRT